MDVGQTEIVVCPLPIPVVDGMDMVIVVVWPTSQVEMPVEHSVL